MYTGLILLISGVACVFAAPSSRVPTVIPILDQSDEWEANGTYKYSYETGNGIKRTEEIFERTVPKIQGRSGGSSDEGGESGESNEIHVQRGSYSYTAPDGTVISLSYIADENGFRPIGKHIQGSTNVQAASVAGDSIISASEPKMNRQLARTKPKTEQPTTEETNDTLNNVNTTHSSSEPSTVSSSQTTVVPSQTTTASVANEATTTVTEQSTTSSTEQPSTTELVTQQSTNTETPTTTIS